MIIIVLILVGLCLGSFVNALVWRLHEQESKTKKSKKENLSIARGRSMCPNCNHSLAATDLIPVLSWIMLGGKCRYCSKPISVQYPLVELATASLFVASYIWWPASFDAPQAAIFVLWLVLLTGFMALVVYDLRWYLLPNRIVYPLSMIAGLMAIVKISVSDEPVYAFLSTVLAVVLGGGIFYLLFQVSNGKWIGGGDVKLGAVLGLVVGAPANALLVIFLASLLGSIVSLVLIASKRRKKSSLIPFGPFLIAAAVITVLFGSNILDWYDRVFINF